MKVKSAIILSVAFCLVTILVFPTCALLPSTNTGRWQVEAIHNVAVLNALPNKNLVCQGYSLRTNVTVENQGDHPETFDTTLYATSDKALNTTGLVGEWKFDEGSDTIAHDSSGNGNDGTIHTATWTAGREGTALHFNGNDSWVEIPNSPLLTGMSQITLEAWIQAGRIPSYVDGIISKHGEYFLITIGGSGLMFEVDNVGPICGVYSAQEITQVGRWYHVAGTWSGNSYAVYVDGQQIGGGTCTPRTTLSNTLPLQIGRFDSPPGNYFNGTIDDVKIYNRSLSHSEILNDMYKTIPIDPQTVTDLAMNSTKTLTFTWNTAGVPKGNYTISAYAWPVSGETDTTDNNFTGEVVTVSMAGDVAGKGTFPNTTPDGKIDIIDLAAIAKCYGADYPNPRYYAIYDINDDSKIDVKDLAIAARNYGKTDP